MLVLSRRAPAQRVTTQPWCVRATLTVAVSLKGRLAGALLPHSRQSWRHEGNFPSPKVWPLLRLYTVQPNSMSSSFYSEHVPHLSVAELLNSERNIKAAIKRWSDKVAQAERTVADFQQKLAEAEAALRQTPDDAKARQREKRVRHLLRKTVEPELAGKVAHLEREKNELMVVQQALLAARAVELRGERNCSRLCSCLRKYCRKRQY